MRWLRARVRPWIGLGVVFAIVGLVLDGTVGGVALAAAAVALLVGVIRALMGADMSGAAHGGEGGL